MAATADKQPNITKQEGGGIVNMLRTVRDDLRCRIMNHNNDSSSNSLIANHPTIYLVVEGSKEIFNLIRDRSRHEEK